MPKALQFNLFALFPHAAVTIIYLKIQKSNLKKGSVPETYFCSKETDPQFREM